MKNPQATDSSKHCRGFTGRVTNCHPAGDGDAKWEMPRNKVEETSANPTATIVLRVTEVLNDPDPFLLLAEAKKKVRVEIMPQDFPHFPTDIRDGRQITVWGLWISDEKHEGTAELEVELHPTYSITYKGQSYFSGKRNAGSPVEMRPKGGKLLTDANHNTFRYCWYPDGNPCQDWDDKENTFFK